MKRAAIAIGSNSTKMLAAEVKGGALWGVLRGREETRLFLGLDRDGRIQPRQLEETALAVSRLARQAREAGAQTIDLFATSATRDAKNGPALAQRIRELCGLELRVISGQEEARLAFLAVSRGQRRLVMDIGGGSTEWTVGENNRIQWAVSMQLGASRLLRAFPIESRDGAERALDAARETMLPYARQLKALPPAGGMTGLGGTCTTAASIHIGRPVHGEAAEGISLSLPQVLGQLRLLSSLPMARRRQVPGLPPERADHMPHGLCILAAGMETSGMEEITVSGRTNLDGYLLSLPEEETQEERNLRL